MRKKNGKPRRSGARVALLTPLEVARLKKALNTTQRLELAKLKGKVERKLRPIFNSYKNRTLDPGQLSKLLKRVADVYTPLGIPLVAAVAMAHTVILHAAPQFKIKTSPVKEKSE